MLTEAVKSWKTSTRILDEKAFKQRERVAQAKRSEENFVIYGGNKLLDLKFPTLIWYPPSNPILKFNTFPSFSFFLAWSDEIKCDVMNFSLTLSRLGFGWRGEAREKSTIKTDSLDLWLLIEKIFCCLWMKSSCFAQSFCFLFFCSFRYFCISCWV